MQKVRVNVQQLDSNNVIIPSANGIQFTGIIVQEFIYAKCVYGNAPIYVKIPIDLTIEATEEYTVLQGFLTKELHFCEGKTNLIGFLEQFSYYQIEEHLKEQVDNAVKDEINSYNLQ